MEKLQIPDVVEREDFVKLVEPLLVKRIDMKEFHANIRAIDISLNENTVLGIYEVGDISNMKHSISNDLYGIIIKTKMVLDNIEETNHSCDCDDCCCDKEDSNIWYLLIYSVKDNVMQDIDLHISTPYCKFTLAMNNSGDDNIDSEYESMVRPLFDIVRAHIEDTVVDIGECLQQRLAQAQLI